ncbi:hypothetical protein D3C76_1607790 [compost metagenome]
MCIKQIYLAQHQKRRNRAGEGRQNKAHQEKGRHGIRFVAFAVVQTVGSQYRNTDGSGCGHNQYENAVTEIRQQIASLEGFRVIAPLRVLRQTQRVHRRWCL